MGLLVLLEKNQLRFELGGKGMLRAWFMFHVVYRIDTYFSIHCLVFCGRIGSVFLEFAKDTSCGEVVW